jgi:hypothetical protein
MGPELRSLVERHLVEDLKFYGIDKELHFDWSDSCIEGHDTNYLDGSLENFSGIAVFDNHENLVADGWMEFIHEGDFFLAYWNYVTTWESDKKLGWHYKSQNDKCELDKKYSQSELYLITEGTNTSLFRQIINLLTM